MKLGEGGSAYMQHGRGLADRRVSMVGPCPPRNGKKDAVRGNFNLSQVYILLIKLLGGGEDQHTCNMEGVSGQARAPSPEIGNK